MAAANEASTLAVEAQLAKTVAEFTKLKRIAAVAQARASNAEAQRAKALDEVAVLKRTNTDNVMQHLKEP